MKNILYHRMTNTISQGLKYTVLKLGGHMLLDKRVWYSPVGNVQKCQHPPPESI